ncbi:MAG: RpiB/LacA/LacB family sugar-phosphate isomerase, partial [Pedobacter sp.]
MPTENKLKIAIGSDHAGFDYKELVKDFLANYEVKDFGTYSNDSVDYPDFA